MSVTRRSVDDHRRRHDRPDVGGDACHLERDDCDERPRRRQHRGDAGVLVGNRGGSGIATGTTSWRAVLTGVDALIVTARDAAGNVATDVITVNRQ